MEMSEIIKLNVGGKIIMSKKDNLIKIPLIEKLLTTKLSTDKDENENIFIDRNPDMFEKILNKIRNGKEKENLIIDNDDDEFIDECKYYLMPIKMRKICEFRVFNLEKSYYSDENKTETKEYYPDSNAILIAEKGDGRDIDDNTELFNELIENKIAFPTNFSYSSDYNGILKYEGRYYDYIKDESGEHKFIVIRVKEIDRVNKKLVNSFIKIKYADE